MRVLFPILSLGLSCTGMAPNHDDPDTRDPKVILANARALRDNEAIMTALPAAIASEDDETAGMAYAALSVGLHDPNRATAARFGEVYRAHSTDIMVRVLHDDDQDLRVLGVRLLFDAGDQTMLQNFISRSVSPECEDRNFDNPVCQAKSYLQQLGSR